MQNNALLGIDSKSFFLKRAFRVHPKSIPIALCASLVPSMDMVLGSDKAAIYDVGVISCKPVSACMEGFVKRQALASQP